jgi:fumarate hydratase subunit alpha
VTGEVANWATSEMRNLVVPLRPGCRIGRSHVEASALMLEAMAKGNLNRQDPWERKVTDLVNSSRVGPLGLGGTTTVLGTFINIGPLRASGVRIVSMRPCCCFEPRRATVVLS